MEKHGISIGIERYGSDFLVVFTAVGKLTHEDYQYMVPLLESALAGIEHPSIYALVDVTQFEGWELQAAWDDLKLSIKHARQFERIALLGGTSTQEIMVKMASWFTPAKVKSFMDKADALAWLRE